MEGAPTPSITWEDALMIADFDDFSLWVYYIVDDICQQVRACLTRPGPAPTTCSDSELLAMAIIGECRGHDMETELLSFWSAHRDLFPPCPRSVASTGAAATSCRAATLCGARSCRCWMWRSSGSASLIACPCRSSPSIWRPRRAGSGL